MDEKDLPIWNGQAWSDTIIKISAMPTPEEWSNNNNNYLLRKEIKRCGLRGNYNPEDANLKTVLIQSIVALANKKKA